MFIETEFFGKGRFLLLDMIKNTLELGCGLLGSLLRTCRANLSVLKIGLDLIVELLELGDLFDFLGFHLTLLLLHVGKLVDQLRVARLVDARVVRHRGYVAS